MAAMGQSCAQKWGQNRQRRSWFSFNKVGEERTSHGMINSIPSLDTSSHPRLSESASPNERSIDGSPWQNSRDWLGTPPSGTSNRPKRVIWMGLSPTQSLSASLWISQASKKNRTKGYISQVKSISYGPVKMARPEKLDALGHFAVAREFTMALRQHCTSGLP